LEIINGNSFATDNNFFIDLLHIGHFRTVASLWRNIFGGILEKVIFTFLEPKKLVLGHFYINYMLLVSGRLHFYLIFN
jgi:hypothetical protein